MIQLRMPGWARPDRPRPGQGDFSSLPGEDALADALGGARRPMSGAGDRPYDVATPNDYVRPAWLVDSKETAAKGERVTLVELEQLRARALREGRRPMRVLTFWRDGERQEPWALVRLSDLEDR